jgi:hypothetical protein
VGITLDITKEPFQLVQFDRFKDHSGEAREYWQMVIAKIKLRQSLWGGITAIDRTGVGDVVMSFLEDTNAIGYSLQESLRAQIISEGVSSINLGKIGIPSLTQFHEEGSWFAQDELRDFDQDNPDNWDFICALFISIWLARGNRPGSTNVANPTVARAAGVSKYAFASSLNVRPTFQRPAARIGSR